MIDSLTGKFVWKSFVDIMNVEIENEKTFDKYEWIM